MELTLNTNEHVVPLRAYSPRSPAVSAFFMTEDCVNSAKHFCSLWAKKSLVSELLSLMGTDLVPLRDMSARLVSGVVWKILHLPTWQFQLLVVC